MLNLSTNDLRFTAELLGKIDFKGEDYGLDEGYLNDLRSALIEMSKSLESTGEFEINIPDKENGPDCGCEH